MKYKIDGICLKPCKALPSKGTLFNSTFKWGKMKLFCNTAYPDLNLIELI